MASKLKLRRYEFRSAQQVEERDGKDVVIGTFDYKKIAYEVLMTPGPGGHSTDEIAKSVLTYGKIKEAFDRGEGFVLLDKEAYDYFLARLNAFRWGRVSKATLDFIEYLRGLKEEEFEVGASIPAAAPAPASA